MDHFKSFLTVAAAVLAGIVISGCQCNPVCDKTVQEDHLQIGWARRSIAKEGPVPITGQFYLRISHGVFTPVVAQALVLSNQKEAVIFVSCDMISVHPAVLLKVQELLKKEAPFIPAEKLIVNATHTHAGPSSNQIAGGYPRKQKVVSTEEMRNFIARQITDAVKEAWQKRAPGSVAYGYGFAATGHSRRTIYFDDTGKRLGSTIGQNLNGKGRIYGKTNDDMFDCYESGTDSFINLLYTFDKKGKLSGAVINVPCPAQTNEHAWVLHAGFWHNVREKLAEKYGDIGVIAQSAAAGDLAPRQLHYLAAEKRRLALKYPELLQKYRKNPLPQPKVETMDPDIPWLVNERIELLRAEDIANRITAAFDEVLSWAQKDKMCSPVLKHSVKTIQLERIMYPKELLDHAAQSHKSLMTQKYIEGGDPWDQLFHNSVLRSRRGRLARVIDRYKKQQK